MFFNTALSDEVFAQTYPVQLKQQVQYFIGQIGKYGIGYTPAQIREYGFFNASAGQGGAFKTLNGQKSTTQSGSEALFAKILNLGEDWEVVACDYDENAGIILLLVRETEELLIAVSTG